jgi:hypothetical protein
LGGMPLKRLLGPWPLPVSLFASRPT